MEMVPSAGQSGNCSARDVLGQCPVLSVALCCLSTMWRCCSKCRLLVQPIQHEKDNMTARRNIQGRGTKDLGARRG